jgi:2-keto-4-pentenoate hydratase
MIVGITDVEGKAKALYEARRNRVAIAPFTDDDPTLGMADGYAVQKELVRLILADGDRIVGYKAGLTSRPMQRMLGVDQPDYGPVLESTVYRDGDAISVGRFIQPKVEAEIVLVLDDELRGPGVTAADARHAVSGAAAAMEIVDSRFQDWRIKLCDTVADMASNGAVAVAEDVVPLDEIDVRLIGMVLTRNGALVDTGAGAAALGNPLEVVAWLANTLATDEISLRPGHLIMTGALHAAVPMLPGEQYLAEFDRLGSVRIEVVE